MSTADAQKPSKEQIINWYKEQIEVAEFRVKLAELNARTARYEYERQEQVIKLASMLAPDPSVKQHTVTQEDLDNNPELSEQGVKVGDVIGLTNVQEKEPVKEEGNV